MEVVAAKIQLIKHLQIMKPQIKKHIFEAHSSSMLMLSDAIINHHMEVVATTNKTYETSVES